MYFSQLANKKRPFIQTESREWVGGGCTGHSTPDDFVDGRM